MDALVGDTVRVVDPEGRVVPTGSSESLRDMIAPALMAASTLDERLELLDLVADPLRCTDPVLVLVDLADHDAERYLPADIWEQVKADTIGAPAGAIARGYWRTFRRHDSLPTSLARLFPALETPPPAGVHVVVINYGASLAVVNGDDAEPEDLR